MVVRWTYKGRWCGPTTAYGHKWKFCSSCTLLGYRALVKIRHNVSTGLGRDRYKRRDAHLVLLHSECAWSLAPALWMRLISLDAVWFACRSSLWKCVTTFSKDGVAQSWEWGSVDRGFAQHAGVPVVSLQHHKSPGTMAKSAYRPSLKK